MCNETKHPHDSTLAKRPVAKTTVERRDKILVAASQTPDRAKSAAPRSAKKRKRIFYLPGIAARPTEKLATQIILFAFQTIFFLLLKKSESHRNFDRVSGVCSRLYLFQMSIVKALDVHCIESKRLNDIE